VLKTVSLCLDLKALRINRHLTTIHVQRDESNRAFFNAASVTMRKCYRLQILWCASSLRLAFSTAAWLAWTNSVSAFF